MAEHYPDDGAATNDFVHLYRHEFKAHLLYESDYPAPPDMWVKSSCRLNTGGVPVPTLPSRADRRMEIARIRSSLLDSSRNQPRYAQTATRCGRRTSNAATPNSSPPPTMLIRTTALNPRGDSYGGESRRHAGRRPRAFRRWQVATVGVPGAPSFSSRHCSS
ncbi:Homeobox protein KNOX3 [Hordeum vulgare]|nr:Homeobox protein KNOX3 [Hordeum vulgare]